MAFNSFSLSGSLGVVAPCRGGLNAGSVLGHHPREPLAAAPHGWDRVDNKKPDRQTYTYLSYSALHHFVCNTFSGCKSINIVPGVDLITSVGPNLFSCQYSIPTNSLRHQAITPVPDLPFPLHGTNPGALSTPSLLILCMPILSCMP